MIRKFNLKMPLKLAMLTMVLSGFWLLHGWLLGRMTGGGSFFASNGVHVTHGFELYCQQNGGMPPLVGPNNLEVNWDGNHFRLDLLTANSCTCHDSVTGNVCNDSKPPAAPIDTYNGCGLGTYNGIANYYACFTFTDKGEPGTNDTATFNLWTPSPQLLPVFSAGPATLDSGNQQAHFVTGGKLP
jgi:hypothetical protein